MSFASDGFRLTDVSPEPRVGVEIKAVGRGPVGAWMENGEFGLYAEDMEPGPTISDRALCAVLAMICARRPDFRMMLTDALENA